MCKEHEHIMVFSYYKDSEAKTKSQRAAIQAECDCSSRDYARMHTPVQWRDDMTPFKNKKEAETFVDKPYRGPANFSQIAVPYYVSNQKTMKREKWWLVKIEFDT